MTAPTQDSTGTQACTLDTEHTLGTLTTAGFYSLWLDLNALANGDILIVRIKTKVTSGGTSRLYRAVTFAHVQGEPNVCTQTVECMHECVFTIEQTDGTGRSIPWEILSY